MAAYLLRRASASAVVLIGISIIIFFLLHLVYPAPGLDVLGLGARPAQVAAWHPVLVHSESYGVLPDLGHGLAVTGCPGWCHLRACCS